MAQSLMADLPISCLMAPDIYKQLQLSSVSIYVDQGSKYQMQCKPDN